MTDQEIEEYIWFQIRERGITWMDMIGGPAISYDVDHERVCRNNIFKAGSWPDRLIELLSEESIDPFQDGPVLQVPVQDLMRYWWDVCIDQDDLLEDILEDIYVHFKDQLAPSEQEVPVTGYDVDFGDWQLKTG